MGLFVVQLVFMREVLDCKGISCTPSVLGYCISFQVHKVAGGDGTPSRSQRIYLQLWDTAGQER